MKAQLKENMPHREYLALQALSNSGLKELAKSPLHYHHYLTNPPAPTPSMLKGSALHALLRGEEYFAKEFVSFDGTRRGKDWEAFKAANSARTILTNDEWSDVYGMRAGVQLCPLAMSLMKAASVWEVTALWNQTVDTGTPWRSIACKARPDFLCPGLSCVVDIKTTLSADEAFFSRQIFNLRYHWQAAWYLLGLNNIREQLGLTEAAYTRFAILAVENKPPYAARVFELEEQAIELGVKEIEQLLPLYARCLEKGEWPGYPEEVSMVGVPRWAYKQAELEETDDE